MTLQELVLKKNEERRLLAGHLWIYSNEVDTKISPLKKFTPGELAKIKSAHNKILGIGYINPNTLICARLLTTDPNETIDVDFFIAKINRALAQRDSYFVSPFYRLIFGESDGLPGLVVDRFGDVLVVQINTFGMENLKDVIVNALTNVLKPTSILLRNDNNIRTTENLPGYIEDAYGKSPEHLTLEENGVSFIASIKSGQKTGWFYDQRTNRARLASYVKNKKVLDVFSYTGGFGVAAAVYGATSVTSIDASEAALNLLKQNAELNKVANKITTINSDAFTALKDLCTTNAKFDLVILDPPAFIKRKKDVPTGFDAYLRLHRLALQVLQPQGLLMTTSCSMHLTREMLLDVLRQSMLKEKRLLSITEQLHQAQDHPVHPAIPETDYLKGCIVQT